METNFEAIQNNTKHMSANDDKIASNEGNITSNAIEIQTNVDSIAANNASIVSNDAEISSNSDSIKANKDNITLNEMNIKQNVFLWHVTCFISGATNIKELQHWTYFQQCTPRGNQTTWQKVQRSYSGSYSRRHVHYNQPSGRAKL